MRKAFLGLAFVACLASCGKKEEIVAAGASGKKPEPEAVKESSTRPPRPAALSENEKALFSKVWEAEFKSTSWVSQDYADGRKLDKTTFHIRRKLEVYFTSNQIQVSLRCDTSIDEGDDRRYTPTRSSALANIKVTSDTIEILESVKKNDSMYREFGSSDWWREYKCHASLSPVVFNYKIEYDSRAKKNALRLIPKSGGDERHLDIRLAEDDWHLGPLSRGFSLY